MSSWKLIVVTDESRPSTNTNVQAGIRRSTVLHGLERLFLVMVVLAVALSVWTGPLSAQSSDSAPPYRLGLAAFLLYDPDHALLLFEQCITQEPQHEDSPQGLDCLYWSGRAYAMKAALAWFYRTSIVEGLVKGRWAIGTALDRYEHVLAKAPNHVGALLSQAEYYMAAPYLPPMAYGDVAKARALVARGLALDADNPRAHYLQARLDLYHNNRRDQARTGYARVRYLIEKGIGGVDATLLQRWVEFAQAEVAFLDEDYPAAIAYADAYIRQVPDGADGYALKGASLKFMGRAADGEVQIQHAQALNPHVRRYREP